MIGIQARFRRFAPRPPRVPADPPRRWIRREWMRLVPFGIVLLALWIFNVWLGTCGFEGCPSAAAIRPFQPSEAGRIVDPTGLLIGRLEEVRRVNVPLPTVPKYSHAACLAPETQPL